MTFEELVADVVLNVKRPDLIGRIESAVKASILKAHQTDFYYRDLIEVPIIFDVERYLQQFVPVDVIPRFRKAKYIRMWHGGPDGRPGLFLTPIQIENSVDNYAAHKTDVFYMSGNKLQIRGSGAVITVLFGCYVHPLLSPLEDLDSWIAREYPYVVVYDAVAFIFQTIGALDQASIFRNLYQEELYKLKISNIDDVPVT